MQHWKLSQTELSHLNWCDAFMWIQHIQMHMYSLLPITHTSREIAESSSYRKFVLLRACQAIGQK